MTEHPEDFPRILEETLQRIIREEGYVTYNVEKKAFSTEGIGLLAKPFFVNIEGKTKDGEKQTNIYVKSILPPGHLDAIFDFSQVYTSEAFVYNDLSRVFTQLQDEAGIPEADRFKMIKSYGVSNSKGIFLENVAIQGYQCMPRTDVMTMQVAELAIREIAKFHAFSFIIQEKRPDIYKQLKEIRLPMRFNKDLEAAQHNIANIAVKCLKEETKEKIQSFKEQIAEKYKYYLSDDNSKTKVLCHGDFRLHNLLLKSSNDDMDLMVLDYQLINMNNPVYDIIFFLFLGTDGKFRKKNFEYLKNLYHDYFSEFLRKFGLDSNKFFPKKEYEKDFRDRLDYGLVIALYFLPITLKADDKIPNPEEDVVSDVQFTLHECFQKRFQEIVDDFIEWGVL